jgi:hypothetical protein
MPNPRILIVSKPNSKNGLDTLLEKIKQEFSLEELPESLPSNQGDLLLRKVDEGIDAVVLYTLKLVGTDRKFQGKYRIKGLEEERIVRSHHQGLPPTHMPGLSFIDYLTTKQIPSMVVAEVNEHVKAFLCGRLKVRFVLNPNIQDKYIVEALRKTLYPQ